MFEAYLDDSAYCVAGFSKGAIDAAQYVSTHTERIDKLQLFSPAFFLDKGEAFKRAQLHYFRKNSRAYIENFLCNAAYPSQIDLHPFLHPEGAQALESLLDFAWPREMLEQIVSRGVRIEVYLGERDKIVDAQEAYAYFLPYATLYLLKGKGHILNG